MLSCDAVAKKNVACILLPSHFVERKMDQYFVTMTMKTQKTPKTVFPSLSELVSRVRKAWENFEQVLLIDFTVKAKFWPSTAVFCCFIEANVCL
jgi:hypothetical protein